MTGPSPPPAAPGAGLTTVYFLSDYGLADEFAGVVHAVLRRLAPGAAVIDLTHDVPPFDVAAGAAALTRALPHLGRGVVLAVVDPGVGGARRPVALRTATGHGDLWMVGPDNGLLVPAAEAEGGIRSAVHLRRSAAAGGATTFDGRDLFAPAAAALCRGEPLASLGQTVDPAGLHRLTVRGVVRGLGTDGRSFLQTDVRWVDHFGNAQLGVEADEPDLPGSVELHRVGPAAGDERTVAVAWLRRVGAFDELGGDELGLLADANGRLAVVARARSAAAAAGLSTGDPVKLVW